MKRRNPSPNRPAPMQLTDIEQHLAAEAARMHEGGMPGASSEPWTKQWARPLVLAEIEVGELLTASIAASAIAEMLEVDRYERSANRWRDEGEKVSLMAERHRDGLSLALVSLTRQIAETLEVRVSEMHDEIRKITGDEGADGGRDV